MNDCDAGTISAILSYCGSIQEVGVNYSLLVVNIAAVSCCVLTASQEREHEGGVGEEMVMSGEGPDGYHRHRRAHVAAILLSLVFGEYSWDIEHLILNSCGGTCI